MNFHHLKRNRKSLIIEENEIVLWRRSYLEKTRRQAFLEGFSPGFKAPSGRGRRLITTHIGSDSGFLENGLNVFESRRTGDYHEDMNSAVFEIWFSFILSSIELGAVVVMDNASYHSQRTEKLPTSAWKKDRS
ncbi:hypothetical protein NQ317_001165 [Molorchus minor]|uniref:Tc1-like transposase DDE domain-containing protein n=1 Tax=Molorchus minor TaxID=1323400 RepID=A0ABQ9JVU5_9CUCU|nr:hypothetical protein NQ317_001165 [Molorchus minor]